VAAAAGAVAVAVVAAAAEPLGTVAYDVLDAFGGFARLVRRSPTLDGSVSLRATQGCVPLLEGNALGHQVVLTRPLVLERKLGRWRVCEDEAWQAVERARRAALPMLRARGILGADAWPELERGVVTTVRGEPWLWTGLCVRPRTGSWLLVTSVANRRNRAFEVRTRVVPVSDGWVPLVLELRPAAGARTLRLVGEVACIVTAGPGPKLERVPLSERPEAARGHLRFYVQEYFEAKKRGEITRRYRKTIEASAHAETGDPSMLEQGAVVEVGPSPGAIETIDACLLPMGPAQKVPAGLGALSVARFDEVIGFSASWDGHTVALDYDRAALRELAAAIEPAFIDAVGPELVAEHPGALLYLTKYFTPHPPGEPHFFVKPWAFTVLPRGWSALVDGVHAPEYDVMRGVVHADQFFATPAVFQLFTLGRRIEIPAGRPLVRVIPLERARMFAEPEVSVLEGVGAP
jgi:hypothetical protein